MENLSILLENVSVSLIFSIYLNKGVKNEIINGIGWVKTPFVAPELYPCPTLQAFMPH